MSRVYKSFVIAIMIIFVFVQIFCINILNTAENTKVYNTHKEAKQIKTFSELNQELNCLKEKNILSANEIDGKWHFKIKIKGNKDELLNEILKLKNYDINNYIINKNENENSVVIEISDKEI